MKSFKNVLIVFLLAVFGFGTANAEFRFGIKAGLNLNDLDLSKLSENFTKDNSCGYTVGIMTEFQVPLIGLGFDISAMYTRMNSEMNELYGPSSVAPQAIGTVNNKNFLEIPVNLKYKISLPGVGKIVAPFIFTGPAFAFKLDKDTVESLKTKTCQVAWNVGLGLQLVKHLQIAGSYGFGINNIAKDWVKATDLDVKNNYWTITAAWLF